MYPHRTCILKFRAVCKQIPLFLRDNKTVSYTYLSLHINYMYMYVCMHIALPAVQACQR